MTERSPNFVLAVAEAQTAELLAAWLTEKKFPAEVVSVPPTTTSDPLTHASMSVPGEFQVWVKNPEHLVEAKELIDEQRAGVQALREREAKRATMTASITAECEECGKSSDWPGVYLGTTQDCPHCLSYMDIPDPDEKWDDVDFGSEDEDETGTSAKDETP